jgi:hypothetical protein
MLVLDYILLFMALSFAGAEGSVWPGAVMDYFSGVGDCVGKSSMVHDAHLYLVLSHTDSFGASCQGEMASFCVV